MNQNGHMMYQKGLKMYEKRQKMEKIKTENHSAQKPLAERGDTPPP